MRMLRIAAVPAALVGALTLSSCVPPGIACPAIGFVYAAPVVVEVDQALIGDGSLAACLGDDCEPALIEPVDAGRWEVPQEPPYAPGDTIGLDDGDGIRIVITDVDGGIVRDDWYEIPYTGGSDGFCPGPREYQSVIIS